MPVAERGWISKRIETLTESSQEVMDVEPEVYNSFNTWSALKLILHSASVNMYTTVISNYFDDFFYIDALAGSGVSEYGNGRCFLGSPIIAAKAASEPFTKMYFIEGDEENKLALEKRLEFIFSNPDIEVTEPREGYEVLYGDTNDKIEEVLNDFWDYVFPEPKFHFFSFIDNQGLNFDWKAMEELGDYSGDYLVNYPAAQGVGMNMNNEGAKGALQEFFGREMWNVEPKDREHYKQVYMKQMESLGVPEQVATKIDSGRKSYYYDMIYATQDTNGSNGYIDAVKYVKEFIEAVDGSDIEELLDVLQGDQSAVSEFLPESDDIDTSLIRQESETDVPEEEDTNQTGLHEF